MFRRMTAGKKTRAKPEYRNHRIGNTAERQAREFLVANGLDFIQSNFRTPFGEIDLIMRDRDTYVFVEVRFRRQANFGDGAESVHRGKQRKIINSAYCFLQTYPHVNESPCRFDVLSVSNNAGGLNFDWIKDAFQAD